MSKTLDEINERVERRKHRQTEDLNKKAIQILKTNRLLEIYYNLSRGGRQFINKAIRKNQTGEPFSKSDFHDYKKGSFKTMVFNLRHLGLVKTVCVYGGAFYKVVGFTLDPSWEKLTAKATQPSIEENADFYKDQEKTIEFLELYLEDMEEPAIHNIRIHFNADYYYDKLEILRNENNPGEFEFIKSNKSFMCAPVFDWGRDFSVTIIVTSKSLVEVMFKNTLRPIVINESGIYELISKLGVIKQYLTMDSDGIPPVGDWIFKRADYGRDSKKQVNANFVIPFKNYAGAMCQIYAKRWKDGKSRLRVEKIIKPELKMSKICENVLTGKPIDTK